MNTKLILFIAVLIFTFNIYVINRIYHRNTAIAKYYSIISSQLKTGDIILFRANDASLIPIVIFGDSFSHIGMVYEKNGQLYIVESVGGKDHNGLGATNNGVTVSPLYAKLLTYHGSVYLKQLNKPLDLARLKLFDNAVDKYSGSNFHYNNPTEYAKNCVLIAKSSGAKSNNFNCAMIISRIIQDIDLIRLKKSEVCMRPQCFNKLYNYGEYIDGYYYNDDICKIIVD